MVISNLPNQFPFHAEHVQRYLERIGVSKGDNEPFPAPNLESLEKILDRHIKSIPFGALNLTYYTILDKPVEPIVNTLDPHSTRGINVDPMAVYNKLVIQNREGFCFEHNSLLRTILDYIGFECILTFARIYDPEIKEATGVNELQDITHCILIVKINNTDYLVDAGFSHYGTLRPVPIDINAEPTCCEGKVAHRITKDTFLDEKHPTNSFEYDSYCFEAQFGTNPWRPFYTFSIIPYYQCDLVALNFYFIHSPEKIFSRRIIVSKFIPDGYVTLFDNELTTRINGKKQTRMLTNELERRITYKNVFGIDIPDYLLEHLPSQFDQPYSPQ